MKLPAGPAGLAASLGLLLVAATSAWAGGSNLAWDDCGGLGGGWSNRNFLCDTNAGESVFTISFSPYIDLPGLVGINAVLDLQSTSSPLPPWWRYRNPGTCRQNSLSANTTFPRTCVEPWTTPGTAGIAGYLESFGSDPTRARILATVAVPASLRSEVLDGTEYYALNIAIDHALSVGTGSCAGCSVPVCIVLLSLELLQVPGSPGGDVVVLNNPLSSHYVTWQGGAINTFGCPGGSPTVSRTWGLLKSLYR